LRRLSPETLRAVNAGNVQSLAAEPLLRGLCTPTGAIDLAATRRSLFLRQDEKWHSKKGPATRTDDFVADQREIALCGYALGPHWD
jgi:hypothetical protein